MKRSGRGGKDIGGLVAVPCTACNAGINLKRSTPFRHPLLDVLICKKCRNFYGSGEWTRDENGQDEFCRWCAEGGNLYICCKDDCLSGFCKKCIRRNFSPAEVKEVEDDDDWLCYICNPEKLKDVQKEADSVFARLELRVKPSREAHDSDKSSKENGVKSPQASFQDLRQALEEVLTNETDVASGKKVAGRSGRKSNRRKSLKSLPGESGAEDGRAGTVWRDIESRLADLRRAMEGGNFREAAKLVDSFIEPALETLPPLGPPSPEFPPPPSPEFPPPPSLAASPERTAASPERTAASPERTAASPERIAASPKQTAASPKQTAASPERTAAPPERTAASPERTAASPERTAASPERTAASPERTAASPERTAASLERTAASPERTAASPERTAAPPERTAASPERTAASPERTAASPERTAASPERTAASSEGTAFSTGGTAPSPERTAPPPEGTAPPPERTSPPPERTSPPPERTAPSPERTAPSPERTAPLLERTAPSPPPAASASPLAGSSPAPLSPKSRPNSGQHSEPQVFGDAEHTLGSPGGLRGRINEGVKEALKKLVEVSRGNPIYVRKSDSPDLDSPFLDSDEESDEPQPRGKKSRDKKRRAEAGMKRVVDGDLKIKSEPVQEDEVEADQRNVTVDPEDDPVDRKRSTAGPIERFLERSQRDSTPSDKRIVWEGLTVRDFVSNGLQVRLKRVEAVLDNAEEPETAAASLRKTDEEELPEVDLELLRFLRDPVRRRRLKRNIRHVAATRNADLNKSSQNAAKKLRISESGSENENSEEEAGSPGASVNSPSPLPSDALALIGSENEKEEEEEEEEVMPRRPSSDSDNEIQVIAEVRASRKKKPKRERLSDSDDIDGSKKNGVDDEGSGEERPPLLRRAVPATIKDEPSTSKRKKAQKNCDTDASSSKPRRAKRRRVRIIDSDEEDASEDEIMAELSPLVSDSGSELEEPEKPKRKRTPMKKRAKIGGSDSDERQDGSAEKKERSIRKIISDDKVEKESRAAAKEEAERRKRVLERQKLYNEIEAAMQKERKTDKVTRCVLEYDTATKEPIVEVDEALVRSMKPHQVEGVKFLYNTVIESVEQVSKGKPGGGAILAHCMGLGKTFQTICLLHTILAHEVLKQHIKKIIVVCPCNVVLNWAREFEMWVEENVDVKGSIAVHEFSRVKNIYDRLDLLEEWNKNGGVLIIGYSMFRLMSQNKTKSRKVKDRLPKLLHDPGADVVVCDEGHTLKSDKAQISKAMNLIRTRRRIILTGTPLQNNMSEYHCMVSFVKPNLLGTPKEFNNRFMNPITYGQEATASSFAVRQMKKRVHILNKLLAGCVHRCDYSHLTPYLPAKFEYIISIELSELQKKLYREYLKYIGITEDTTREDLRVRSLLKDYQVLKMVWSHPYLLLESEDRQEDRRQREAYKNQLDEFVVEGSEEDTGPSQSGSGTSENEAGSGDEEIVKTYKTRRNRKENPGTESEPEEDNTKKKYDKTWWISHVPVDEEEFISLGLSSKLSIAFEILRDCELIGDKVILFSTSLLTLSLFERNLQIEYEKSSKERTEGDYINSWVHGLDYFRLDGSTSVETRKRYIDQFNDTSNLRARLFLVSTKAGGIGTNMVGANRIIVLDASWNPSDDTQAIFRAFRYGQAKPVYVYRLLAHATMEEKIYDRQVNKISLASRVVDEQNLERHFNESDLKALYEFKPEKDARKTPAVPKDRLLAELLIRQKALVQGYHEHDSLLQKELEDELTEEERKQAWKEYEDERDGKSPAMMPQPMPGLYSNIPGFTMPGFMPGGLPGGIPGMPNFPGQFPNYGMPGPSGFNPMPNQTAAQMASHIQMAALIAAARARLPNNASYAAYHNQFLPRAAQRPASNPNFQPRAPNVQRPQAPTVEEILNRPPHFDSPINHPSLNPQRMLNEIKLRNPQDNQFSIAQRFKSALKHQRDTYALGLSRMRQFVEAQVVQGRIPPPKTRESILEFESGVKICDHLVIGLENSLEKAKNEVQHRKEAGSSRPPVIDLDGPTAGNNTGQGGPIIEEID